MSTESMLKALINPLVTGGCHNRVNRSDNITLPYVVFHEVEGEPITGISQVTFGLTRCEYEIVVYAPTPEHAKSLALNEIKEVVMGPSIEGVLTFQCVGPYIKEDNSFQYITQYQIWEES